MRALAWTSNVDFYEWTNFSASEICLSCVVYAAIVSAMGFFISPGNRCQKLENVNTYAQ